MGPTREAGRVPCGSGTKIGLGNIPRRLDLVLSTVRLTQVSEYDVANFTITAGAGMTFAQLTQLTAAHMQMLPLQYPSALLPSAASSPPMPIPPNACAMGAYGTSF